jgi:hypothetical protein
MSSVVFKRRDEAKVYQYTSLSAKNGFIMIELRKSDCMYGERDREYIELTN